MARPATPSPRAGAELPASWWEFRDGLLAARRVHTPPDQRRAARAFYVRTSVVAAVLVVAGASRIAAAGAEPQEAIGRVAAAVVVPVCFYLMPGVALAPSITLVPKRIAIAALWLSGVAAAALVLARYAHGAWVLAAALVWLGPAGMLTASALFADHLAERRWRRNSSHASHASHASQRTDVGHEAG